MKTKFFLLMVIVTIACTLSAKEPQSIKVGSWAVTKITISSGKGALTSGFDTQVDFSNLEDQSKILFVQANNDRIGVSIGKSFGKLKVLETIAVFKNIPWTGPMIIYSTGPFDFIAWNGMGFGKTKELLAPSYKPQFFFSYEGVGLTFCKNNRISASAMWFATTPVNWFVSYKRNIQIGKTSSFFVEATYNHALDIPMFVIGYSVKIQ